MEAEGKSAHPRPYCGGQRGTVDGRGSASPCHRSERRTGNEAARRKRLGTYVGGAGALLWLILRTGIKPSRLSYPCQQSALAMAAAAFGVPLVAALIAGKAQLLRFAHSMRGKVCAAALALSGLVLLATASFDDPASLLLTPPENYHADVYFVRDARGTNDAGFGGVDDLVTLMGTLGTKLHQTAYTTLTSGPNGIIESDDVVLIKVNAQWPQRGGTNTDVLRGLMRNIVAHPYGFTGEIIVADNGQGYGNLNRSDNNAEDVTQSPQDVVAEFAAEAYAASTFLWDTIRTRSVSEFDAGDYVSGYVVDANWDAETSIKVSYPKFTTAHGTRISYKHGIWNETYQQYEADRLVVINLPVLKTHSIYGVTAAVKNHMGVITTGVYTDSHLGVGRGGLGSVMAEVRAPDLNILDCIWVLARPGAGPSAQYSQSSLVNQLAASTDSVAIDAWAVKHILMPQIIANGFSSEQYWQQDPDNGSGEFRQYLDRSMSELLLAGKTCSNDYVNVKLHTWTGDLDRDGDLDLTDFSVFPPCLGAESELDPSCVGLDYNLDGAVDLSDFAAMQNVFTDAL